MSGQSDSESHRPAPVCSCNGCTEETHASGCECEYCHKPGCTCKDCGNSIGEASGGKQLTTATAQETIDALLVAVNKVDLLSNRLLQMENVLRVQTDRLEKLEESGHESGHEKSRQHKGKSKKGRVEEEKERSFKVI